MAIITITITESILQLLDGIPSYVILETSIPSTIFYTLDSTDPTTDSFVSVGKITLPTNSGQVVLKALATNGEDYSAVFTQVYTTNVTLARNPHDQVTVNQDCCAGSNSIFGGGGSYIPAVYGNTTGPIVDNQEETRIADGYDGTSTNTGAGFINDPKSNYQFRFSETDAIGEVGKGIGTLPGRMLYSTPRNDNRTQTSSNTASALFNPKALVIFQDSGDEPYDTDVPKINRAYFDLEDHTKARDGTLLTNTEAVTTSGSFVKAHYNSADNTLTYYYYDNRVNRWIISKEKYSANQNPTTNLSGIVSRSGRAPGSEKVFKWIPFRYRSLI